MKLLLYSVVETAINHHKKGRRRRKRATAEAEVISELVSEQEKDSNDMSSFKTITDSITEVLMVEVDNVAHDPYKSTEEVKVGTTVCGATETLLLKQCHSK